MKTTMTVILILLEIVLAELTNNVRERAADCYFFLLYAKEKKKGSLQVAWLNSTKKKEQKKLVDGCAREWIRLLSFTFLWV